MKENALNTIWQVPVYLPYLQPELTDEILATAEANIGYKLPSEYVEILKTQNGGYIRYTITGTPHSEIYGVGPYFPSLTDFNWTDYLDYVKIELNGLVPFDGDGHWYFCVDYRKNIHDPQITFIDTESDAEEKIAENFKEYLRLLQLDTKDEYVVATTLPITNILEQISDILKINFEEPDWFAHGYPIYRALFYESSIWVSPNKVPKGFVRKNDERYDELKPLMEGTSLRYPEIAEEYLLMQFSQDKEREMALGKLKDNSFVIRPLADIE